MPTANTTFCHLLPSTVSCNPQTIGVILGYRENLAMVLRGIQENFGHKAKESPSRTRIPRDCGGCQAGSSWGASPRERRSRGIGQPTIVSAVFASYPPSRDSHRRCFCACLGSCSLCRTTLRSSHRGTTDARKRDWGDGRGLSLFRDMKNICSYINTYPQKMTSPRK